MDDKEPLSVRLAAVKALSLIVEQGDAQAVTGISALLEDTVSYVRLAAVQALSLIAEKGDEQVIAAVRRRLDDDDDYVRAAASAALTALELHT